MLQYIQNKPQTQTRTFNGVKTECLRLCCLGGDNGKIQPLRPLIRGWGVGIDKPDFGLSSRERTARTGQGLQTKKKGWRGWLFFWLLPNVAYIMVE